MGRTFFYLAKSSNNSIPVKPCFNSLSEEDQAPTSNEILAALSKLKNYKSPGIDGICNEQLKFGAQALTKPLMKLFSEVWESETVPKYWLRGVITIIPKKSDISKCSNNRGITLRSTTSKLFQMVMLERLSKGLENAMRENQCGFRKNRSCVDQIFSLRAIIRQCMEYKLPLYINFVDFKSAFDCINRNFIWQAFRHYGLPDKYVRVIRAFCDGTSSAVQYNGELSRWFDVANGTGQGDIQGPPIFNVYLNWAAEMHKAIYRGLVLQEGTAELEGEALMDTDYEDDMAVLDGTKDGLQETTDILSHYAAYSGLKINSGKTKTMAISKQASQRPYTEAYTLNTTVDDVRVEQVSHFTYLGAVISADGTLDKDLDNRIGKASGAFNSLSRVWYNRNILTPTKIRIYRAAVLTVLLYGSETWSTIKNHIHRVEVFHQRCLRRIMRIKWFSKTSNEIVLQRAGIENVATFISRNILQWFGMPSERLTKKLVLWKPTHGKRSSGRPSKSWLDCVKEDYYAVSGYNSNVQEMTIATEDRKEWRTLARLRERVPEAGHSND